MIAITFYKDGFKFHINNQRKKFQHKLNVINKDESIQIVAFGFQCAPVLWHEVVDMMVDMHNLLYLWIFHGTLKLLVICPKCLEKQFELKAKNINAI